jgi:4-amino-4-deoxy-L-arabinose transferase-like glycosyltransferase
VLHFGGYTYPARYPQGYSLILAVAYPLIGHAPENFYRVAIALGLAAVGLLYLLALKAFDDRGAAIAASAILAVSPVFVTDSTLVLSDVPALALAIAAALAIALATRSEDRRWASLGWWVLFSFIAGFELTLRQTNFAMVVAGIACVLVVRNGTASAGRRGARYCSAAACVIAFAAAGVWQALSNWHDLGSPLASGYVFWVPEVYGFLGRVFNPRFLFGPTMPRNPIGNAAIYAPALIGLDGMVLASMGDRHGPLYSLYPAAGAAFAAIGLVSAGRGNPSKAAKRVIWFGALFLGLLFAIYLLYFFTDTVFLLPGSFVLFLLAGLGFARANRTVMATRGPRSPSGASNLARVAVVLLDLVLVFSVVAELSHRLESPRNRSEAVPALREVEPHLEPNALVISNVSLQFLELYLDGGQRRFVGLHSFESDSELSDYHLGRLYAKASEGFNGDLPPVMFRDGSQQPSAFGLVADQIKLRKPAYLLLFPPQSPEYDRTLRGELDQISAKFEVVEQQRAGPFVLFRLGPR